MLATETGAQRPFLERVVERDGLAEKVVQRHHVAAHNLRARESNIRHPFPTIESGTTVQQIPDESFKQSARKEGFIQQPVNLTMHVYATDNKPAPNHIQRCEETQTKAIYAHRMQTVIYLSQ